MKKILKELVTVSIVIMIALMATACDDDPKSENGWDQVKTNDTTDTNGVFETDGEPADTKVTTENNEESDTSKPQMGGIGRF